MKKFVLAAAAISALVASPALARSDTHISFGFYSPAPVYYEPAPVYYAPPRVTYYQPPVVYYPPVQQVYYAPPRYRYGYGYRHRHHHRFHDYARNDWDDDDCGGRWRH